MKKKTAKKVTKKKAEMPISIEPALGKLHGPMTMFMQMHAGEASDTNGTKYLLGTCVGTGAMIVSNTKTNKKFSVSWEGLIALAKKEGIDHE
jgi:hypothetical protein